MTIIAEVMQKNPICCSVLTRIDEIQRLMKENNLKEMPIVDNMLEKHLLGVVSESDIQAKAKLEGASPSLLSTEQCLKKIPLVSEKANAAEIAELFKLTGIDDIPVMDRAGRYCGIVKRDLLRSPSMDQ